MPGKAEVSGDSLTPHFAFQGEDSSGQLATAGRHELSEMPWRARRRELSQIPDMLSAILLGWATFSELPQSNGVCTT